MTSLTIDPCPPPHPPLPVPCDREGGRDRTTTRVSLDDKNMADQHPVKEDVIAKTQAKVEHLARIYNGGKPLFPRSLLADLDDQIQSGNDEVYIYDLDDVKHTYSLKVPSWCLDCATTYRISYNSIQFLTHIHPAFPEISFRDSSPISICYISVTEASKKPLEEVQVTFERNRKTWQESDACKTLEKYLSTLRFSNSIHKIVGFGLGTLSGLNDDYHSKRSHTQHAAIETMVKTLSKLGLDGGAGIKCFVQDPAYNDVDHELLRCIGIEPLDDPKGFLEIDESTLVISVSPNIPVKQVVADVQWPAAMLWNTVSLSERENLLWKREKRNGEEIWVVPFTTDPDSKRVRNMVEHYTKAPLRDFKEYFGDVTLYVRSRE